MDIEKSKASCVEFLRSKQDIEFDHWSAEMGLDQVLSEMHKCAAVEDHPLGHDLADTLLIALILSLTQDHPERETIEQIVDLWDGMVKWYS